MSAATFPLTPLGSWMRQAECKGKSHIMFPTPVGNGHKARWTGCYDDAAALCAACPVKQQCTDYYLTVDCADDSGYAAGMEPRELRARRARVTPAEVERRKARLRRWS